MSEVSNPENKIKELKRRLEELERENTELKRTLKGTSGSDNTVNAPESFMPIFEKAQETVKEYFNNIDFQPSKGTITINDDRYVLIRASALSNDFFKAIKQLYRDEKESDAFDIGQNFLFDIGHLIGMEDAKQFHKKMKLKDPIAKLSAGPVHFAYSGWAFVDILPESNPSPDENYFLKYHHPYSFEADSWLRKNQQSDKPVCIMNAAYSSGWCQESFGIQLTAVEIACKAKGDENCTFIMAPPHKIQEYLIEENTNIKESKSPKIPVFFERRKIEQGLKNSLNEKEILLKEIHHRVKNNLQIINSFLNLQFNDIEDPKVVDSITKSKIRINSMALIHTKLYQSDDLSSIDFGEYIHELVDSIMSSYVYGKNIVCNLKHEHAVFDIDLSVNLGLIITELLTNACKHAFKERNEGVIQIELLKVTENQYRLVFEDDGVGPVVNFKIDNPETLGLSIVNGLVGQINGSLNVEFDQGLRYTIDFEG